MSGTLIGQYLMWAYCKTFQIYDWDFIPDIYCNQKRGLIPDSFKWSDDFKTKSSHIVT